LVIEDITKNECEKLVMALNDAAMRLEKSEFKNGTAHFGITDFEYNAEYSTVLEKADSALSIAETQPENYQFASGLSVHHSNAEWREQIEKLIIGNTSDFAAQAIKASTGEELYSEWFARLPNKSSAELIPMAQLIPASIRLDAAEKLDKMIVKLAFEKIKSIGTNSCVGLNLSRLSILNQSFQSWFLSELSVLGSISAKIVLEIPEKAIVTDTPALLVFVKSIHEMGAKITIERFGAQLAGVRHLREIQPDFLKIDGRYIKNIHNEVDNQLFVQSLVSIAHGLNIKIIAETVESIEESNWLANIGVDYQQGYHIDTPKII
jgi:EAL domain-containing protein (putative c-di-GMP-specific phosphodiesterase class I)